MSFIVQCLCVCPAAPRPHLPSLLITAHYREVKQINQKALSQSLWHHEARLQAPPQPTQSETGPQPSRVRIILKDTAGRREKKPSQSLQFRSPPCEAPSLHGPINLSPNISPSVTSPLMLLVEFQVSIHQSSQNLLPCCAKSESTSHCPCEAVGRADNARFILPPLGIWYCARLTASMQEICWINEHMQVSEKVSGYIMKPCSFCPVLLGIPSEMNYDRDSEFP